MESVRLLFREKLFRIFKKQKKMINFLTHLLLSMFPFSGAATMKKLSIIFIAFLIPFSTFAFKFKFIDKKGDKFVIINHSLQEVLINNRSVYKLDQRNKGDLTIIGNEEGLAIIEGKYEFFQRPIGDSGAYRAEQRTYKTRYKRKTNGEMNVESNFYYPIVRNLPVFPDNEINPGDSWEAEGEECQDFRERGISDPYKYKINVFYRYLKDEIKNNETFAVIEYFYYVNERFNNAIEPQRTRDLRPVRIFGVVKGISYWDKKLGYAKFYENSYNFVFINRDGSINEFKGQDKGEVNKVPIITRQDDTDIRDNIARQVRESNTPVEIRREDRGISLNFSGEVLFDFGSSNLRPDAVLELKQIAGILKQIQNKYPGVEIRVEGHSDNIGAPTWKQFFSDGRAKAVSNFLIKHGVDPSRISFHGFSDSRPIAGNETAEGRAKNRRVEIKIITR